MFNKHDAARLYIALPKATDCHLFLGRIRLAAKVTSTSSSEGEHMTLGKHLIALLFSALAVMPCSIVVFAQTSSEVAKPGSPTASVDHDGQHDFDSFAGTWKCHTKYRAHPSLWI
jgi:hypothetical protein